MQGEATRTGEGTTLYVAIEMGSREWKLGMGVGPARMRQVTIFREELGWRVEKELRLGKEHFGLGEDARSVACYEAGRDGFWPYRLLTKLRVECLIIEAASVDVDRRARRCKTDTLDLQKLYQALNRHDRGEPDVWSVVRVPSEAEEDERRAHRERERLVRERTRHIARLKSMLALAGAWVERPQRLKPEDVDALRDWEGKTLPSGMVAELKRELERLALLAVQIRKVAVELERRLAEDQTPCALAARRLKSLCAVGPVTAVCLAYEFFGWRKFRNRREVGALAGLVGAPYNSGESRREQGISKAGNRIVRWIAVEFAWSWLRYQPDSALTTWFHERFGSGKRSRRIGIVALARKLLVALWRYVDQGLVPQGARVRS